MALGRGLRGAGERERGGDLSAGPGARHLPLLIERERERESYAPRTTCEPGTMSSAPSGQRTHALWPPS